MLEHEDEKVTDVNSGNKLSYDHILDGYSSRNLLGEVITEEPLDGETVSKIHEFLRGVRGYHLDDFPPGSCNKWGERWESNCSVNGPVTIEGKLIVEKVDDKKTIAYKYVNITDGRYVGETTKEKGYGCDSDHLGTHQPQGSFKILVKKGLGIPNETGYTVSIDHNDGFGRDCALAADHMCTQIVNFLLDTI